MPRRKSCERALTPLELEIINVLWESGPANVQTVQSQMKGRELAYSTVQTMLNILHHKGKVKRQLEDRAYVYHSVLNRKTATSQAVGYVIDNFFGGSAESLVLNLVEARSLTPEKLAQILSCGLGALAFCAVLAFSVSCTVRAQSATASQAQSSVAKGFDVVSIRPISQQGPDIQGLGTVRMLPGGHLLAEKVLLRYFIQNAYGVKPFQVSGGPAWIDSAHYDIDAKAEGNPNQSQIRLMMRALLEERFKLNLHHETKQLPVYEVTVAKSGPKLPEPREGGCIAPDPNGGPFPPAPGQPIACGRILVMMSPSGAQMRGGKVSMTDLINILSNVLGRTVVDKTGLQGTFDVHLEFTPDETLGGIPTPPPALPPSGDSTRSAASLDSHGNIFAAIQEQLGLKLESAKGPVDVLVIDSVERPSAN